MSTLKDSFPWAASPLIINAPMSGYADAPLASAVTRSGAVGMIGGSINPADIRAQLQAAAETFKSDDRFSPIKTLPVGVGFLPFGHKAEVVLPMVGEFKPIVVWLFAAKKLDDYTEWASQIRKLSPDSKVWIQCGSVAAAVHIARTAQPDALCLQGADAGGHGFEKGSGIISLLPEATDALAKEGFGHIPLIAAGGIADGRGVAAALALGAQGVVLGTRFLASKEVTVHPNYQAAILEAEDGGQVTTRSKVFDELRGPNIWPEEYDGRSLVVQSYVDHKNGVGIDEIRNLHNEAVKESDVGFKVGLKGRAAIWAGTGVGLVKKVESANDIAEELRSEAKEILGRISNI